MRREIDSGVVRTYCLGNLLRLLAILLLLCASIFATKNLAKADAKSQAPESQPKYALLVGITNYKSRDLNKIDGCENNVPLLAKTLVGKFGFPKENVEELQDEQATRLAILSTFRTHLIGNARRAKEKGREAVIVYYFCGHGSQSQDQDGDETDDGKDETIVAYDSRIDDVPDILDDEIDDLKAELRPYTSNTTLIFESCHSGSASRDDEQGYVTQQADESAKRSKPYKRKFRPSKDSDSHSYVEIAAAHSSSVSKSQTKELCERTNICEKPYSLMTKALVEGLNRAEETTTYRELIRQVSHVVDKVYPQNPQVEGNQFAVLFNGAAKRANPYIEIDQLLTDNRVKIRAGRIHGLSKGSQVAVYESGSLKNIGDDGWLTNGSVEQVGASESIVVLWSNDGSKKVELTSHIVLTSPVFGGGPLLVILDTGRPKTRGGIDRSLGEKIKRQLAKQAAKDSQIVKIIDSEESEISAAPDAIGRVQIKKGLVSEIFGGRTEFIVPTSDPGFCSNSKPTIVPIKDRIPSSDKEVYYIDDGISGGMPLFGKIFDLSDSNLPEKISKTIMVYAFQRNLRGLENTASTLSEMIQITLKAIPNDAIREDCKKDGSFVRKWSSDEWNPVKFGDKYQDLRPLVEPRFEVGSFFAIEIKNISKNIIKERTKNRFAGGLDLHIAILYLKNSGEIEERTKNRVELTDDAVHRDYFFTDQPIGIDRFIVFISKEPVDFSFYNMDPDSTRQPVHILETILTRSGSAASRDGTVIDYKPDSWDVIKIQVEIVKEKSVETEKKASQ